MRLCLEQRTQDDVVRRRAEGKAKREAIRCVKRDIAREISKILRDHPHEAPAGPGRGAVCPDPHDDGPAPA